MAMPRQPVNLLRPITRISLHEQIIDQIKQLIVSDQFRMGDRLPSERELAQQLSASRHSVREALRVLHAVGILEIYPGSGTYVSRTADVRLSKSIFETIVEKDLRFSVLEARRILEPGIAALAAVRATNQDLAAIEHHVVTMEEQVREGVDYTAADLGFHLSLASATQNLVLIRMIKALENLLIVIPPNKERAAFFHRLIYAAVKSRDSKSAFKAMEEHLLDLERNLLSGLRSGDGAPAAEQVSEP
jgi:GntR family transcriptional repressor for pyruvate dehydrogenase complex